jgi:6-phosphogluconolactonase (cycloisomerase 2 family)
VSVDCQRGRWPWFFALTDDGRMIVANNLSDNITIFDIDPHGRLHASGQVAVRRPVFISPAGRSGYLRARGRGSRLDVHGVR